MCICNGWIPGVLWHLYRLCKLFEISISLHLWSCSVCLPLAYANYILFLYSILNCIIANSSLDFIIVITVYKHVITKFITSKLHSVICDDLIRLLKLHSLQKALDLTSLDYLAPFHPTEDKWFGELMDGRSMLIELQVGFVLWREMIAASFESVV